jgi:hypothetical protein
VCVQRQDAEGVEMRKLAESRDGLAEALAELVDSGAGCVEVDGISWMKARSESCPPLAS